MKKIRKMMWTVCFYQQDGKAPYPFAMYIEIPEQGFFVYSTYDGTELPLSLLNPGADNPVAVSEETAMILVEEELDSVRHALEEDDDAEEVSRSNFYDGMIQRREELP